MARGMTIRTISTAAMLAVALAGMMVLPGCKGQDNVKAPQTIRTDPLAGGYPQNIALAGLHEGVVIGQPMVDAATADQPMQVAVPLRSVADHTLRVQYKFMFLDGRGRPVKSNLDGWRYQVLAPRAEVFLEASAMDTDAADWRLEVRPAR